MPGRAKRKIFSIPQFSMKAITTTGAKAKPKLPPATKEDITRPKLDLVERKVAREVPRGCIAATANPKKNKIGKTGGRLFK